MDIVDLDRARGTLDAYDGVEIRLRNDVVVRTDPLTVREAAGYLRLLGKAKDDPDAHAEFLDYFPKRLGLDRVRLVDLGLEVEAPDETPLDLLDSRYRDVGRLAELVGLATYEEDEGRRSRAQLVYLRRVPKSLRIAPERFSPGEWFALGHRIVEDAYTLVYGLAQDFCSRSISGPRNRTLKLTRARSGSRSVSTIC